MITFLLPSKDYDPTESAIIWEALAKNDFQVQFATPDGKIAHADPRLTDIGFGLLSPILMTRSAALKSYKAMSASHAFNHPVSYDDVNLGNSQGIFVPGGHAQGVKTLLESGSAQGIVVDAFKKNLPVGCVCHGAILMARSIDPDTGKSVLYGRKTTGLVRSMELSAWAMTWLWLRNYYRTYSISVETEVKNALASPNDFQQGPLLPIKDSASNLKPGFTVRDGNYISGRWPGDCYKLANEFVDLVKEHSQTVQQVA